VGAITLEQAQAQLSAFLAANLALSQGKSYTLANGVTITRESSSYLLKQISYWTRLVERLGGRRVTRQVIPFDG